MQVKGYTVHPEAAKERPTTHRAWDHGATSVVLGLGLCPLRHSVDNVICTYTFTHIHIHIHTTEYYSTIKKRMK